LRKRLLLNLIIPVFRHRDNDILIRPAYFVGCQLLEALSINRVGFSTTILLRQQCLKSRPSLSFNCTKLVRMLPVQVVYL